VNGVVSDVDVLPGFAIFGAFSEKKRLTDTYKMSESTEKKQNIVYVLTKGPENAEVALLPFVHAVGALVTEIDASIVLLASAVMLAQKGTARHVRHGELAPLDELMNSFLEFGGKIYLCTPCYKGRGYDETDHLVEGVQPIAAATYNEILLNADAVVSY